MRRVIVLMLLALALPMAAWANGINIVNNNGTIALSLAGITSSNSHVIQFNNQVGHFGFLNYKTGSFNGTNLFASGTFNSDPISGFFDITNSGGIKGVPKGPIFTGNFVGPIMWNLISESGNGCPTAPCTYQFQLVGNISGTLWTGNTVSGNTVQNITVFFGEFQREGDGHMHLGQTHLNTPEPGTLALLGTGLVGIATVVRRKLVS